MILEFLVIGLFGCVCMGGYWLYRTHQKVYVYEKQIMEQSLQLHYMHDHLQEVQSGLDEKEKTIFSLNHALMDNQNHVARLEEKLGHYEGMAIQMECLQKEVLKLSEERTILSQKLESEQAIFQEKNRFLTDVQGHFLESFKNLANESLKNNEEHFLKMADGTLQKLKESTLDPLNKALSTVDQKIEDLEKARLSAYSVFTHQVQDLIQTQKELRLQTSNLVKALRNPTVRGQWGEMQLKRVVEMAGMISHCDFYEQVSVDDGRLRPDMVVSLPNNKKVIIDAKAPLSAYLEALEAEDDSVKEIKLAQHAKHIRTHIRALSQRSYWEQFDHTPEFVVLFLPGETFFSAALEKDPSLIEAGVREKIILATPTTLIALLRAVAYGWQQEAITTNAKAISDLGRTLYKRLCDLGGHMGRLGRSLGQAVETYNQSVGTLERRVFVTARKFQSLDEGLEAMEEITPLDAPLRTLHAMDGQVEDLMINNAEGDKG